MNDQEKRINILWMRNKSFQCKESVTGSLWTNVSFNRVGLAKVPR